VHETVPSLFISTSSMASSKAGSFLQRFPFLSKTTELPSNTISVWLPTVLQ
jgi:hypothetical protein